MATVYSSWSPGWKPSGSSSAKYFRSFITTTVADDPKDVTKTKVTVKAGIELNSKVGANDFKNTTTVNGVTTTVSNKSTYYDGSSAATKYTWFSKVYTYTKKATSQSISITNKILHDSSSGWGKVSVTRTTTVTIPALKTYSLKYYKDGELVRTDTKTHGVDIELYVPDVGYGFTFTGWQVGDEVYSPNDITKWSQNANTDFTILYEIDESIPRLTFGEIHDTKMEKWTVGYSVATIEVTDAYIPSGKTIDYIKLTVGESSASMQTEKGTLSVKLGSAETYTPTLSVKLVGETPIRTYSLGEINAVQPTFSVTYKCVTDDIPDINQRGEARLNLYAWDYVALDYKLLGSFWKIRVVEDGFYIDNVQLEHYLVSSNSTDTVNCKLKLSYDTTYTPESKARTAFFNTTKSAHYNNGLASNIFIGGADDNTYSSRVWHSALNNPLYFPETNYVEVGSNDTSIMGLVKVGEYLGVIKQSKTTDTAIYLLYPTSFDDMATYAIKQSVNGVGAISKFCFNILGDETLFLSPDGIMAIEAGADEQHRIQNRSYYINKPLINEEHLENAYSFVWNGLYLVGVNNKVYVLDGNQKTSWETSRTNLQYEAYVWDNIPSKGFAKKDGKLYFHSDTEICMFGDSYTDNGEPVKARWSTILDNDGDTTRFKTLQKKGNIATLLADTDGTSARVSYKADGNNEIEIIEIAEAVSDVPIDIFPRKKMKKYKRLQIIVDNDKAESFGVSEIVKSYVVGVYAKNR